MDATSKFSTKKRIKSFFYAFSGLKILIREEHNSRIHLVISICVIFFGFILKISKIEWIVVFLTMGYVFTVEIINSAIENLADCVTKEQNELIKKSKDLSAAAVLISAFIALIIGTIIFLPKIINLCCRY